jgi:hypothetical protein
MLDEAEKLGLKLAMDPDPNFEDMAPSIRPTEGGDAFQMAIRTGKLDAVHLLLARADIRLKLEKDSDYASQTARCMGRHATPDLLRALLDFKYICDAINSGRESLLSILIDKENVDCVRELLTHKRIKPKAMIDKLNRAEDIFAMARQKNQVIHDLLQAAWTKTS